MGKPSISMGFENRTTCCMCPPPLSPSSFPLPGFTRPPLDTRADSFPRERWLQTVPNVFPDIEEKYGQRARRENMWREDVSEERNALRNINVSAPFFLSQLILTPRSHQEKKIDYGFTHLSEILKRNKSEKHPENIKGFKISFADFFCRHYFMHFSRKI